MRQRLADLQSQLRIAQGEKERRVSQLEERDVSIVEYSEFLIQIEFVFGFRKSFPSLTF